MFATRSLAASACAQDGADFRAYKLLRDSQAIQSPISTTDGEARKAIVSDHSVVLALTAQLACRTTHWRPRNAVRTSCLSTPRKSSIP